METRSFRLLPINLARPAHRNVSLPSKQALAALGLFGITALILKDALFLGGAFYERDLLSIYASSAEAFVRTVTEGALPLRDPTTGFGQPLLGNPDAQILYPPTWLHLVLLPERVYPLFVLFHFLLGATGASALCWRFSRSSVGSFFAGAFWLVSGPFQSFLSVWHHLAGAAWMPWVLTAFDHLLENPDRRRTLVLATAFGLQILAGSADMCAMTLGLALLRFLCEMGEAGRARILVQCKSALVALAIAASLGAGVWMTVAELSRSSLRGSMPEATRTFWSVHPALLSELVLPLRLADRDLNRETREVLYEGREPFVRSLFLGPLVLPLFVGALAGASIPMKYRRFAGVGALGCLLVSLGRYAPVHGFLTTLVPPLAIFRYPSKLMIPFSLLACVLSGAILLRLSDGRARRLARAMAVFLMALHALWFVAAVEILPQVAASIDPMARRLKAAAQESNTLLSIGTLLVFAVVTKWRRPRAMVGAALAAVAATLVTHLGLNPVVARPLLRYRPEHVTVVKTIEPSRLFVEDYVNFKARSRKLLGRDSPFTHEKGDILTDRVRFVAAFRANLVPPVGGAWGIEYAWDTDLRGLYDHALRFLSVLDLEGSPAFLRRLQIGNVSHVASLHTSFYDRLSLEQTVATPLKEPLFIFKVPDPLPRAYAVSGVRILETPAAVRTILDPRFDPRKEVILDRGTPGAVSQTFRSTVRIAEQRSDRVALDVSLNEPGTVVLVDGYLPGWRATIDGVSTPVRRANAVFVALSAPAGNHRVIFLYRPWTAVLGMSLTGLTALGLLISFARSRGGRALIALSRQ